MPKDRLKTIIKWAKDDKVDRWERHRNPLIEFPALVDKIDFELGWS